MEILFSILIYGVNLLLLRLIFKSMYTDKNVVTETDFLVFGIAFIASPFTIFGSIFIFMMLENRRIVMSFFQPLIWISRKLFK